MQRQVHAKRQFVYAWGERDLRSIALRSWSMRQTRMTRRVLTALLAWRRTRLSRRQAKTETAMIQMRTSKTCHRADA